MGLGSYFVSRLISLPIIRVTYTGAVRGTRRPTLPKVPLFALWSLLDGIWTILKGNFVC